MVQKNYTIRKAVEDDRASILDFFRRFFFRDEPLNIANGIADEYINGGSVPELEQYTLVSLGEGTSLLAVADSGHIVGVCINGIVRRDEPESENNVQHKSFRKVVHLLETLDKSINIFEKYPQIQRLLDVRILSVDSDWRGLGIAKRLVSQSRDVAVEFDCQLVKIDCSSYYSGLVAAKLGFKLLYTLNYSEFLDEKTQKPLLEPSPPHTAATAYVYEL